MSQLLVLAEGPDSPVIDPAPAWSILPEADDRHRLVLADADVYRVGSGPGFSARLNDEAALLGVGWLRYRGAAGDAGAARLLADVQAGQGASDQLSGAFAAALTIGGRVHLLTDPRGHRLLYMDAARRLACTQLAAATALLDGPRLALGPAVLWVLEGAPAGRSSWVEGLAVLPPGLARPLSGPDAALSPSQGRPVTGRRLIRLLAEAVQEALIGAERPALYWDGSRGARLLYPLCRRMAPSLTLWTGADAQAPRPDRLILGQGDTLLDARRTRRVGGIARALAPPLMAGAKPAAAGPLYNAAALRRWLKAEVTDPLILGPALGGPSRAGAAGPLIQAVHGGRERRLDLAAQMPVALPFLSPALVAALTVRRRRGIRPLIKHLLSQAPPETPFVSPPDASSAATAEPGPHPLDRLLDPDALTPVQRARRAQLIAFLGQTRTRLVR